MIDGFFVDGIELLTGKFEFVNVLDESETFTFNFIDSFRVFLFALFTWSLSLPFSSLYFESLSYTEESLWIVPFSFGEQKVVVKRSR